MKKLISLVLILCMACMLIPAMAEEDVTGDWYGSMMGIGVAMTVNADGTFSISANALNETGTWTLEGTTFTATDASGVPMVFQFQDGTLSASEMGANLTRNPEDMPKPIEIPDVKADAAAEEFYGEWTCVAMDSGEMGAIDASIYNEQAGDTLPNLSITADSVSFTGDGMIASIMSIAPLAPSFENGVLTAKSTIEAMSLSATFELLQNGWIRATLDGSAPLVLFYAPAEAAEEPAA